jgi:hypothetical protein
VLEAKKALEPEPEPEAPAESEAALLTVESHTPETEVQP